MRDKGSRRLLVVEDQDLVAETVASFLGAEGFNVDHAGSLGVARERLSKGLYDLVILDISLPDGDGLELIPLLNQPGGPAVVIVSGRGEETDRVLGLESGADDYLVKPFSLRELAARVRGVLRRTQAEAPSTADGALRFGRFRLDPRERSLQHDGEGEVPLTTAEFDVLLCLASNLAEIVSRETLTQEALHRRWHPLDRSVDQIIVSLRRKLSEDRGGNVRIITVRGRGYLLRQGST